MGNYNGCFPLNHIEESGEYLILHQRVQRTGRLIQHNQCAVLKKPSGNGHLLPFAAGQFAAAEFPAQLAVQAADTLNQFLYAYNPGHLPNALFVFPAAEITDTDILAQ